MANMLMQRCSSLLIIREMQIKTIVMYHLIPDRITVIEKTTNNKKTKNKKKLKVDYHVVVQSFSRIRLFATPWTVARQASLSFTVSRSLLTLMSVESVMLSNHLVLCCPLLFLPSIFPSIRVFSNELGLCIRWPKCQSFST